MNNINNPIHDPFEDINPIRKVKQEKRNQGDILINRFRDEEIFSRISHLD